MAENICNEVEEQVKYAGGGGSVEKTKFLVFAYWALPSSCGNLPVPLTS